MQKENRRTGGDDSQAFEADGKFWDDLTTDALKVVERADQVETPEELAILRGQLKARAHVLNVQNARIHQAQVWIAGAELTSKLGQDAGAQKLARKLLTA